MKTKETKHERKTEQLISIHSSIVRTNACVSINILCCQNRFCCKCCSHLLRVNNVFHAISNIFPNRYNVLIKQCVNYTNYISNICTFQIGRLPHATSPLTCQMTNFEKNNQTVRASSCMRKLRAIQNTNQLNELSFHRF